MRHFLALLVLSAVPATALAQGTSGSFSPGYQLVENNTNSSKFGEYRDLRDGRAPFGFQFNTLNTRGIFVDALGSNITRRDQSFKLSTGKLGVWRLDAGWDELPHNFSNKAQSPYTSTTAGNLEVPTTMAITFRRLATAGADAANVVAMDAIVAAYAQQYSKPIELDNQTKTGAFALQYKGIDKLDASVGFSRRAKTGSHLSYGPIGDRPPRTLNIQLAEPVDYMTSDLTAALEFNGGKYQLRAEYLFSDFANDVDVLTWRNVYASPTATGTYDTWDRAIGTYGRRPLAPDNTYQNARLTGGLNLPLNSRFTASFARGIMDQDQELLPYAYQSDLLVNSTLPRTTAEARMNTTELSAEYSFIPVQKVNVRAFFKRFDLENETPSDRWQYATGDASSLTGTVSYVNKRVSEPIAFDRQNMGVDATWRLGFLKSSIGFGFEREDIGREHRQAEEVGENILRASWRAQPATWLSLRAKVLRGDRDGGVYNWQAASETYWYEATDNPDNNNPRFTFEDHPDMRKFDMADRQRDQVDFSVGLTPTSSLSVSTSFKYRKDDFDSDVTPVQPLINTTSVDREAFTPGDQLGLLESERRQVGVDLFYAPGERISLNASLGYDVGESQQRGIEFNENNKMNPSAINTATLGPWTRAGSQWTADQDDRVKYAGFGGTYEVVPNRVTLSANYTLSISKLEVEYGGFGVTNFDGTTPLAPNHEFSFTTPAPVKNNSHVADVSIEFPLLQKIGAKLGWQYESYQLRDWQQSTGTAQFETVGTDLLLRDTSRSHQWGNRLFNLGSYLAPGFTAHAVYVSLKYSFGAQDPVVQ